MCLPEQRLGILDFQDAVMGPLTYDLVSLLRDCYIVWPEPAVRQWVDSFYQLAHADGLTLPGRAEFQRWFDLMGVQRHLKAAGIFARLSIRDDKHGYLASIPDTVGYLRRIMPRHAQTQALGQWIETHLVTPLQLERAPT
jgi:aminoglycoside/choline kinase family phosphotransferase